jgi:hypothetical protein
MTRRCATTSGSKMIEIPRFADRRQCAAVISAYDRCRDRHAADTGVAFWNGRVMGISSFPDSENAVRRILQRWRHRATTIAAIQAGRMIFSDTIMVVRWDGQAMPPHRDHRGADGSPNLTPWREWAGIIYLNDNYIGGRLVFPDSGTVYRPVIGSLALFPASLLHAVEAADGMPRYTSPLWFTSDAAKVDPSATIRY